MNRTHLLRAIIRGSKGGLIATAVMTVYRAPVFRVLPPTAELWARYAGEGEPEEYFLEGLLVHFLYGTVAGGLFGPILTVIDSKTATNREYVGVGSGLCYGLLLSGIGTRIVFKRVIHTQLDASEALVFHVGHAIYGLTLGTWLGTRERVGEVYEDEEADSHREGHPSSDPQSSDGRP